MMLIKRNRVSKCRCGENKCQSADRGGYFVSTQPDGNGANQEDIENGKQRNHGKSAYLRRAKIFSYDIAGYCYKRYGRSKERHIFSIGRQAQIRRGKSRDWESEIQRVIFHP